MITPFVFDSVLPHSLKLCCLTAWLLFHNFISTLNSNSDSVRSISPLWYWFSWLYAKQQFPDFHSTLQQCNFWFSWLYAKQQFPDFHNNVIFGSPSGTLDDFHLRQFHDSKMLTLTLFGWTFYVNSTLQQQIVFVRFLPKYNFPCQ